jgi:hypothetical protein
MMSWKRTAQQQQQAEVAVIGGANFYFLLTRPSFKRSAPVQLGSDGLRAEALAWARSVFINGAGSHTRLDTWGGSHTSEKRLYRQKCLAVGGPVEAAVKALRLEEKIEASTRDHIHGLVRCELAPELDAIQLQSSWLSWWLDDDERSSWLASKNIVGQVEEYDAARSRSYLYDHEDYRVEMLCSHPRPCRRGKGCFFERNPSNIGTGWLYANNEPLRSSN